MKVTKKKVSFKDERGVIMDILENTPIEHVTYITIKKGAVRGNHYHKKTEQYAYILNGRIKILSQVGSGRIQKRVVSRGDLVYNPPGEKHTFIGLEDSDFIDFNRGPRGGKNYETDTYRLSENERLERLEKD